MKTPENWKLFFLKRYDWLIKVLFGIIIGLSFSACGPEEPVAEYGVAPLYGMPSTVVNK